MAFLLSLWDRRHAHTRHLNKKPYLYYRGPIAALLWLPYPFVNSEEGHRRRDVAPGHITVGHTKHISCKERDLFQKEEWIELGSFNRKGIRLIWGLVLTRLHVTATCLLA
jgi:hypothetical protein